MTFFYSTTTWLDQWAFNFFLLAKFNIQISNQQIVNVTLLAEEVGNKLQDEFHEKTPFVQTYYQFGVLLIEN